MLTILTIIIFYIYYTTYTPLFEKKLLFKVICNFFSERYKLKKKFAISYELFISHRLKGYVKKL